LAEKNDLHLQKRSFPSSLMLLLGKKSGSGAQAEAEERPISNSEKPKSETFQSETQSKDNSPLQGGNTHGNKAALAHGSTTTAFELFPQKPGPATDVAAHSATRRGPGYLRLWKGNRSC
jgi:hypothetical protein